VVVPEAASCLRAVLVVAFVAAGAGAGSQTPDQVDALRTLLLEARFAEVESRARELLREAEASSGPESIQVAELADVLAESLWRAGRVRAPETRAFAERAVAIKETHLGPEHPDVAFSLTTLGIVVRLLGEYPAATSLFDRALTIQERALGPRHPLVARSLTAAATLAIDTGDLARAQALNERALAIREAALPPGDPAVAENLNGLGVILERRGDHAGAQAYHERALAIRERALGSAHPDVAASLNNLGNVRSAAGDYAAARALYERALGIRERTLGRDHPDVAASLNNLAIAVRDLGDHAAAWWLLERVLGIWERTLGPNHPTVAFATHNLATILVDLGPAAGSRLLAERARRLRTQSRDALAASLTPLVGTDPPDSYQGARALLERSLALKEQALGARHRSVALTLAVLATVLRKTGQPEQARTCLERALAIREQALGPSHPDTADTLDRLGELLAETGEHAAAGSAFERALAITEQVHGADHPHAGILRQHLAESLGAMGDVSGALRMALDAERIGRDHLRVVGRTLPEREALMYAATRPVGLDVALTLLAGRHGSREVASGIVWDAVVRSRALVLDEMAFRHRTVIAARQADIGPLVADLTSTRAQLARLVVRGAAGSTEDYRRELERARTKRDEAERRLAERSVEFRQEQRQNRFGFEEVKAALPSGSAIVAFVRYLHHAFGGGGESGGGATGPGSRPTPSYLAFVLHAATPGEPAVVPLGPAARLDTAIANWRRQVTAVAMAGGRSTSRTEAAVRRQGALLRATIWDPLATHLGGASRVFIVPDGPLHLVNWGALPADRNTYLIEQAPPIHYLSAERDLLPGEAVAHGRGLVLLDSPLFDDRPAPAARVAVAGSGAVDRVAAPPGVGFRGARSACGDFRAMQFDPLPASAREARTIATIWQGRAGSTAGTVSADSTSSRSAGAGLVRLSGRTATEAAFKGNVAGTRVVHLATHGFFLGSRCSVAPDRVAHAGEDELSTGPGFGENPLLLAGFALSGANLRHAAGQDEEDGILTAEEVAALDLGGVEWAVLSACDTGVGEVRAGEGVLGLRRAFQIAGARTVIMSLWPVEDEDTRRWMTGLYQRRFADGRATIDAVRESSLEQLQRRRRAGSSTHPFYWAGFIAAGDWR
jgi:CHAT domain-containing protein/tetratricopeptide (TPR) repeat protein